MDGQEEGGCWGRADWVLTGGRRWAGGEERERWSSTDAMKNR